MLSKNHPIILFIDRFGFSIYQDTLTNISKFNFTPDLVNNLDVVNKEQFVKLIDTFIQINKIIGSSLVVILSENVIYTKDLVNSLQKAAPVPGVKAGSVEDKDHQDEVQGFLEDVPFEEVLARVIKMGQASRIVAANKDLIMAIADTFVSKGSVIEAVTPSFMYGQSANFTAGLTSENVKVVLANTEILKAGNLLTDQEKMILPQSLDSALKTPASNEVKKPKNMRQYILIGVFVILLIILVIVYFTTVVPQTPPENFSPKTTGSTVNKTEAIPTQIPALVQQTPIISSVDLKQVSIIISNNAIYSEIAANLKNNFATIGLQNVVSEVSETSAPEKSSVTFSQTIPADLRNNIIAQIRKILPNISILENQNPGFTINIIIGRT